MTEYIAAIVYPEKSKTYEAFSKISAGSERLGVVSAVLVECDADGRLTIPEGEDGHAGLGLGTGSSVFLSGPWEVRSGCCWGWESVRPPALRLTSLGRRSGISP